MSFSMQAMLPLAGTQQQIAKSEWQLERIMQKMGSDHKPGKKNDVFHQQCDVTSPNCTQIIIIIVVGICQPRETMELEYSFLSFAVTGVTGKSDVGVAVPSTLGTREVCCWSFCQGGSFSTLSFYLSLLQKWPFEAEQFSFEIIIKPLFTHGCL